MIELTFYTYYYLIVGAIGHVLLCGFIGGWVGVSAAKLYIRYVERKERRAYRNQ